MSDQPQSVDVPVWFKTPNGGLLRRGALEPSHPESTYRYVRDQLGLEPGDFGISDKVAYDEMHEA